MVTKNLLSGNTVEQASGRIDVVEWSVVVPYQVISPDENTYSQPDWEPVGWKADANIADAMREKAMSGEEMRCID